MNTSKGGMLGLAKSFSVTNINRPVTKTNSVTGRNAQNLNLELKGIRFNDYAQRTGLCAVAVFRVPSSFEPKLKHNLLMKLHSFVQQRWVSRNCSSIANLLLMLRCVGRYCTKPLVGCSLSIQELFELCS